MKISEKAITAIKSTSRVKAKLMLAFERDSRTVEFWFKKNSPMLTTAAALKIIMEETGLNQDEILEDEPVNV